LGATTIKPIVSTFPKLSAISTPSAIVTNRLMEMQISPIAAA